MSGETSECRSHPELVWHLSPTWDKSKGKMKNFLSKIFLIRKVVKIKDVASKEKEVAVYFLGIPLYRSSTLLW
jgi:hypothetical protein